MCWLPFSYLSKHAFKKKKVPAQGGKKNRQGLAKKEKPKKDKMIPAVVLFNCSL